MNLSSGTRLGPYEIVAPLGAGGMGEVYRARDSRLNRDVALKVLPAEVAQDPARRHRFEQEARAASALNHPNIVTVYDVGTADGVSFIVTELVDGESLRLALHRGPLALRRTLDIAAQIADGLAAAHAAAIVHRDLKPENIMVTRQGRVKILDFGLAKQITAPTATDATLTVAPTQPGMVMGTVGYMSPEQVRGKPADHRSDIFSFGAIMYELLSGKRAFSGESPADIMSAILDKEPPELASPPSPGLDRLMRRCLEKEPVRRFQSAHDLTFAIQSLSVATTPSAGFPVVEPQPARRRLVLVLAALVILAAAAAGGVFGGKRLWQTTPPSFKQLTYRRGSIIAARFAPDGQTIVYGAQWEGKPFELFSARPDSPESRELGHHGSDILAISSTGEMATSIGRHYAGSFLYLGTLARAPLAGGSPREVLEDVQYADWAPDGDSLAVVRRVAGRHRLEFPIGKVLYQAAGWISHPRVSPKGDSIAFVDHPQQGDDGGAIALVDLKGNKKTLSSGWLSAAGLAWAPDGAEVWFTATRVGAARAVYAVTPQGQERLVFRAPGTLTLHDMSRDGRLLVTHDKQRQGLIALAPGETKERDLSWLDFSGARDLTADGKMVLFSETGEGGGATYALYIRKTDGSPAVRIGEGQAMGLSPDAKWALAILRRGSSTQLTLFPTGTGEPRRIEVEGVNSQYARWFPDGKRILIAGNEPGRGVRLYVQEPSGGKPRPISPEGVTLDRQVRVSPDGRYVTARGPDGNLILYPVEGGPAHEIPGLLPGDSPSQWSADGRFLYVFRRGELPAKLYRLDLTTGRREVLKQFVPADPAGVFDIGPVLVTPDAKAYAYTFNCVLSDLFLVEPGR